MTRNWLAKYYDKLSGIFGISILGTNIFITKTKTVLLRVLRRKCSKHDKGKPYNDLLIFPPKFFSASKNVLSGNRTCDLKIILAFGSGRCGHP